MKTQKAIIKKVQNPNSRNAKCNCDICTCEICNCGSSCNCSPCNCRSDCNC